MSPVHAREAALTDLVRRSKAAALRVGDQIGALLAKELENVPPAALSPREDALVNVIRRAQAGFVRMHDQIGGLLEQVMRDPASVPLPGVPEPQWRAAAAAQPAPQPIIEAVPVARIGARRDTARTVARAALLRAEFANADLHDLVVRFNALPGKALTIPAMRRFASCLGLRRSGAASCLAISKGMKHALFDGLLLFGPERDALLRQRYPAEGATEALRAALSLLPGTPLTNVEQLRSRAKYVGLKRQGVRRTPAQGKGMWTPERDAVLRREWPIGTPKAEIWAVVRAMPGLPIDNTHACGQRASELNLRRPPFQKKPAVPKAVLPPVIKPCAQVVPVRKAVAPAKPVETAPRAVVKKINFVAPAPRIDPVAKFSGIPTPAQMQRAAEDRAVADFIARRGVTRCPTGVASPTTATLPAADAQAMRELNDQREREHREYYDASAARIKTNRMRKLAGLAPIQASHARGPTP